MLTLLEKGCRLSSSASSLPVQLKKFSMKMFYTGNRQNKAGDVLVWLGSDKEGGCGCGCEVIRNRHSRERGTKRGNMGTILENTRQRHLSSQLSDFLLTPAWRSHLMAFGVKGLKASTFEGNQRLEGAA